MPSDNINKRYVSYLRVSSVHQKASGLGIEAQRSAVSQYLAGIRGADLLHEYVEHESGKHDDRPVLAEAMEHAALTGATLVIAKLDRLSRSAHFLTGLAKRNVKLAACDMPDANTLTFTIMAGLAEWERSAISGRTKAALQAQKQRNAGIKPHQVACIKNADGTWYWTQRLKWETGGEAMSGSAPLYTQLEISAALAATDCPDGRLELERRPKRSGNPQWKRNFEGKGNKASTEAQRRAAVGRAALLQNKLDSIRKAGHTTLTQIATELERQGITTPRGGKWHPMMVKRVSDRLTKGQHS